MVRFHALTQDPAMQLHVWRRSTREDTVLFSKVSARAQEETGLLRYECALDFHIHGDVFCKLHRDDEYWENNAFNRQVPRLAEYRFPKDVWLVEGTSRLLMQDPFAQACDRVRIHLITAKRYREGALYLWAPGIPGRKITTYTPEDEGIYFDVQLSGRDRNLFAFKFIQKNGAFEPDMANRLWSSADGREIWTHSESAHIGKSKPARKMLRVHYRPTFSATQYLHLWQSNADFAVDVDPRELRDDWYTFEYPIYTGLPYGFMFRNIASPSDEQWEHAEATREINISKDAEVWTLEGDHELFAQEPEADREIILEIVDRPPACPLGSPISLDVWVNQARRHMSEPLLKDIKPRADGTFRFKTYPEIVTSFRFKSAAPSGMVTEAIARHSHKVSADTHSPQRLYVVLDRETQLTSSAPRNIFRDPPFAIARPGAWEQDGHMRFALHAPSAAMVEVMGEWTQWSANAMPMQCTRDGAYWWLQIPLAQIRAATGKNDYHGLLYKYRINQVFERQDPGADWVESSDPSKASRLANHSRYAWQSTDWETPGWDYLVVYQLHVGRFSKRYGDRNLSPLRRVAEEIKDSTGYLRSLKATGILLMPINEFPADQSWGYNPAFFYAVESSYGGPDDLKYLVDTCHQHGLAVMLDVVFNHAGTGDNILWSIARDSYFRGDTRWGAMVNFAHPQVIHFFEQNLVYFAEKFHIDGFRFDATDAILRSDTQNENVLQAGSGYGWEFLHKMRAAVHAVKPRCILVAEQLPNRWPLTRYGGSMDSQWCDAFHDRLVNACRGQYVMSGLADALKTTQTQCNQWYECTNYPESHDEVGNTNQRIASMDVSGLGQGYRRNKVAAAATLFSRGIPMWFMGAESAEYKQFLIDKNDPLDLDQYSSDKERSAVRRWWNALSELRRNNPMIQGPSPLDVRYAQDQVLAFTRGEGQEFYVLLNFGGWAGSRRLDELNLPDASYRELWNSTWPDFAVEQEGEHTNGGRTAHLDRGCQVQVPDYGVVVLQRE